MELYISDHPLDCLTCAANGDCELQDMAGVVGLRDVRYGYDGREPPRRVPKDEQQPVLHLRRRASASSARAACAPASEVQGTFALTIAGRGFDSKVVGAGGTSVHRLRVRLVRRLRAGLPDGDAAGEDRHRARACPTRTVLDHLRLLRRRLLVQGRAARRRGRADGAVQGRRRQRGPLVRQGPLRLGLRHPPGPACSRRWCASRSTDEWREVSWDEAIAFTRPRGCRRSRPSTGSASIGGITSSRCTNEEVYVVQKMIRAAFGNNNVDTCARVCHSPTGYGLKQTFGTSAGTQDFASVATGRRDPGDRRQPDRRPPGVRLADEAAAARRARSSS